MVVVCTIKILGDVHVLDPYFTSNDDAISVNKAGFPESDALNLRSREDKSCCVLFHQEVVEFGSAVLDVDGSLLLFCHVFNVISPKRERLQ